MNEEIEQLERKKKWLGIGLAVISLPTLPVYVVMKPLEYAIMKPFEILDRIVNKIGKIFTRSENSPSVMPADPALAEMALRMAAAQNIPIRSIYIKNESKNENLKNCFIATEREYGSSILFDGNPLLNLENGESIAAGVIGHELGHTMTSTSHRFKEIALSSSSIYALLAGGFGLGSHLAKTLSLQDFETAMANMPALEAIRQPLFTLMSALPGENVLSIAAIGSFALASGLRHMANAHFCNTEHIADLYGAEIAGPEKMISTLEYLDRENKPSLLKKIWGIVSKPADAIFPDIITHPPINKRIDLVKKAHDL